MPGTSFLKPFQSLGAASALVLMTGFSLAQLPGQRNAAPAFKSAHVVSATDVPYPEQSIAVSRTHDRRSSVGIPAFCTPCVLSLSGIRLA